MSGGTVPGDLGQALARFGPAELRAAGEQPLRVGMHRLADHLVGRTLLDDPAGIHHGDRLRMVGNDAEVVGDQQHAHAVFGLQPFEQGENLGLDRHVQRCGRLVGEQDGGAARQAMAIATRWRMPPDRRCG